MLAWAPAQGERRALLCDALTQTPPEHGHGANRRAKGKAVQCGCPVSALHEVQVQTDETSLGAEPEADWAQQRKTKRRSTAAGASAPAHALCQKSQTVADDQQCGCALEFA